MVFPVRAYRLRTETNLTDGLMWQPGWQGPGCCSGQEISRAWLAIRHKKGLPQEPFSFDQKTVA